MNYPYVVNAYYDNARITVQTDDVNTAINELMTHAQRGVHCDLSDGYTGEVYVIVNTDEPYITDEWALTILGWLMTQFFDA